MEKKDKLAVLDNINVDLDFKTNQEAYLFIKYLSQEQMKLAKRQIKKQKCKLDQHQVEHDSYRLSTIRWAFKPNEAIHPLFTFDNVCLRINLDPDEVRKEFLKDMDNYERKLYLMYQPNLLTKGELECLYTT